MSTAIRESALRTIARGQIGYKELIRQVGAAKSELDAVLMGLRRDGLIESTTTGYRMLTRRPRDPQPQPAPTVAAADPAPAAEAPPPVAEPTTEEPPMRQAETYQCVGCNERKPPSAMCQRNGKILPRCRRCWGKALSAGQLKRPKGVEDQAQALAKVVRKHTRPKDAGPLQVRHSREISARLELGEVFITIEENGDATGAVTLTFREAEQLRDWLLRQDLS
jgi:hypothetical protein